MRHEKDRANRRARVQALTSEELDERRERGRRDAERRRAALAAATAASALAIAVDCSYAPDGGGGPAALDEQQQQRSAAPLTKAVRSLAKQLELSAAANRRSARPALLHATSFCDPLASFASLMGAGAWPLFTAHAEPLLEVFPPQDDDAPPGRRRIVVLSPDAERPLDLSAPLERGESCVYVVGGIVDRTVRKGLTLEFAKRHGLECRRLPVRELADKLGRLSEPGASKTPVLNVSDVIACLLAYDAPSGGSWVEALRAGIPARKLVAGVASGGAEGEEGEAAAGRRSRRRAVARTRRLIERVG